MKKHYLIFCEYKKNKLDDLLSTTVKYNIECYPDFWIILFDFDYKDLIILKNIYFIY